MKIAQEIIGGGSVPLSIEDTEGLFGAESSTVARAFSAVESPDRPIQIIITDILANPGPPNWTRCGVIRPELAAGLEALLAQHDYILDTFEAFYAVLNDEPSTQNRAELLSRGTIFEKAFEQHAATESRLLNEINSLVGVDPDGEWK